MKRPYLIPLAVVSVAAAIAWLSRVQFAALLSGLPPREEFSTVAEASVAAYQFAVVYGGTVYAIAGTGSEAPFIPPAGPGEDRYAIVGYAVTSAHRGFAEVAHGELVIYRPAWSKTPVIHQVAGRTAAGLKMTGLNNPTYEAEPIGLEKFVGAVAAVFVRKH